MDKATRGFAPVNGARIYYERVGQGPAIVFIPPPSSDRRIWADQVASFARHFTTVRYDLRGYGKSPRCPGVFRDAGDLVALLEWLQIERAVLIGIKQSADIALEVALDRPDLVTALVLVVPSLTGQFPRQQAREFKQAGRHLLDAEGDPNLARRIITFVKALNSIRLELMPRYRPAKTWRRRRANLRSDIISLTNFPHMLAIVFGKPHIDWRQRASTDAPMPSNSEWQRKPWVYERLAEVQSPALLMYGNHWFDVQWLKELVDELAEKLPHAVVTRAPGSTGLPQMEFPAVFNNIVLSYLHELAERRL